MRISGQAFVTFQSIIRETAMNFENKTKTLAKSGFFSVQEKVQLLSGKCPRLSMKKRLKKWLSYRKGTSKDGSAGAYATKAELAQ